MTLFFLLGLFVPSIFFRSSKCFGEKDKVMFLMFLFRQLYSIILFLFFFVSWFFNSIHMMDSWSGKICQKKMKTKHVIEILCFANVGRQFVMLEETETIVIKSLSICSPNKRKTEFNLRCIVLSKVLSRVESPAKSGEQISKCNWDLRADHKVDLRADLRTVVSKNLRAVVTTALRAGLNSMQELF